MNKELIARLRNGEIAAENNGTFKVLQEAINEIEQFLNELNKDK